ncbi:hypothetical protein PVAND_015389 [Polypedilum vanderplanki]|uniref:Secreted protein n=1 Tax=Polypedilum vanderplanki TaxID=319348 RepID=A0A9J6BCW3_POLVA|nr:hypothetical protein PVAND_015389 [Polypedilum vanderplanki]
MLKFLICLLLFHQVCSFNFESLSNILEEPKKIQKFQLPYHIFIRLELRAMKNFNSEKIVNDWQNCLLNKLGIPHQIDIIQQEISKTEEDHYAMMKKFYKQKEQKILQAIRYASIVDCHIDGISNLSTIAERIYDEIEVKIDKLDFDCLILEFKDSKKLSKSQKIIFNTIYCRNQIEFFDKLYQKSTINEVSNNFSDFGLKKCLTKKLLENNQIINKENENKIESDIRKYFDTFIVCVSEEIQFEIK